MRYAAFGEILKQHRKAKQLSKTRLAEQSGLYKGTIRSLELGEKHASDNMLRKLAPPLGVPYETLKAKRIISELTEEEREALKKELCDC